MHCRRLALRVPPVVCRLRRIRYQLSDTRHSLTAIRREGGVRPSSKSDQGPCSRGLHWREREEYQKLCAHGETSGEQRSWVQPSTSAELFHVHRCTSHAVFSRKHDESLERLSIRGVSRTKKLAMRAVSKDINLYLALSAKGCHGVGGYGEIQIRTHGRLGPA